MTGPTINRREAVIAAAVSVLPLADAAGAAALPADAAIGLGRNQPFDRGWRFHRGAGSGFEAPDAADGDWRRVDLPHDWSIEDIPGGKPPDRIGPFDRNAIGNTDTGYTVGGEGWYRKHFRLAALPAAARVEILFDGVAVECEVWLNGHRLGDHYHAYAPFAFELTRHLVRDGDNVVAVRVRNEGRNSRWYAGSGLYRQVTLDVVPGATRVARWGVAAWTRRIADRHAEIDVTTGIERPAPGQSLVTRLRAPDGRVVAEATAPAADEVRQTLQPAAPALWSPATPTLYTLETEVRQGDRLVDRLAQPFGIRIVAIDAERGLRINGVATKLRGGCIHHDNGLLGARAYADADERRIALLKARGFNAIRSSHNPAAATLRDACARQGMLMIDEAFDMWHKPKLKDDYSTHFATDWQVPLTAMVTSARNNPAIIMWSIGNEIPERSTPEGIEWQWKLANAVRRLDPTRPVTAALHGILGPTVRAAADTARPGFAGQEDEASSVFLDVAGYNYRIADIEPDHARRPARVIYASETYPRDAHDYQVMADRHPYFLGEFVWTAIDYIGEAGIGETLRAPKTAFSLKRGAFPWVNAWCGDLDLIGQQKPQSLARDVVWGLSPIEILVARPLPADLVENVPLWGWPDEVPSWTWPAETGALTVRLHTAGDRVELRLNGKSVAAKAVTPANKLRVEAVVPYAAGTLEAVAFRNGLEIGRRMLVTAGPPVALRLTPDRPRAKAGPLRYVGIEVVDAGGRVVPDAERAIRLTVAGAALIGFGSANPSATGSLQASTASSFRGRALAILHADDGAGPIRVEARSDDLRGAAATLAVRRGD